MARSLALQRISDGYFHPMKLKGASLRSKFGRRIFIMFGLAVTIPAITVFFLTYRHAAELAADSEASTLRVFNKGFALSVFERLQMAKSALEQTPADDAVEGKALGGMFTEIIELESSGIHDESETTYKSQEDSLLLRKRTDQTQIALRVLNKQAATGAVLVGTLDSRYLWGEPEAAIPDGQICVQSGSINLACVGTVPADPHNQLLRDEWNLFLAPEFGGAPWRFVALKTPPKSFAEYSDLFLPVAVGMLLLTLLLSSMEIRRILVPLEVLLKRISAIGAEPKVLSVSDEFATLDRTFQDMELRITRQILMLKTLQEVDQLILAHVPLAEVVGLVTERIRTIVGARPIAISLLSLGQGISDRHFLRLPYGSNAGTFMASDDPVVNKPTPYADSRGLWVTEHIGPSFENLDLITVWCLTVGQDHGPFIRLSLGQFRSEAGHLPNRFNAHSELKELIDRVAVALAAEVREQRLVSQARHDLLTNLPNRLAVLEVLPGIIERAQELSVGFATIFVDLDRFKSINDGLGHVLGDAVLIEVASRIRSAIGPESFVARLGGDEFLVVVPGASTDAAAISVDSAIRAALKSPILIESRSLVMDFTAGIAIYPKYGSDPEMLMHNADVAMYRAKRLGGGRAMLFDSEMMHLATKRIQMENDLRAAIASNQLQLHYQPRVDSRDGSILGAEALIRWAHPVWGLVCPDDFIGLAEECGLIGEIGAFVINSACKQMADWQSAGLNLPLIAINVSPNQLREGDLRKVISAALTENGLHWTQLEIEITESVLIKDSAFASEQLQWLRGAGCTVAIDDFGTGYSSLAYLTSLPTDTIKIDRGFFTDLHTEAAQAVVRSIIALGRTLNRVVVAEGVENLEDVALLNSWGCYIIQGYVYFRPLTAENMTGQLQRRRTILAQIDF